MVSKYFHSHRFFSIIYTKKSIENCSEKIVELYFDAKRQQKFPIQFYWNFSNQKFKREKYKNFPYFSKIQILWNFSKQILEEMQTIQNNPNWNKFKSNVKCDLTGVLKFFIRTKRWEFWNSLKFLFLQISYRQKCLFLASTIINNSKIFKLKKFHKNFTIQKWTRFRFVQIFKR